MAYFCSICKDSKEFVLVFPCDDQHKACRSCVENLVIIPGGAVKCPECRKVHGRVNLDLWKVEGTPVPALQLCASCAENEGMAADAGQSVQFCIDCDQTLCEECFKWHQRSHRGRGSHETVPFDEYRENSDRYRRWLCNPHTLPATEACNKCGRAGCARCQDKPTDCPAGGQHEFVALNKKHEEAFKSVSSQRDAAEAGTIAANDKLKMLVQSMDDCRVEIADRRSVLRTQLDAKIKQLKTEHKQSDKELECFLQRKAEQAEGKRARLLQRVRSLQSLQDGLGAVLTSYHPARLVEDEELIRRRVQEETTPDEDQIDFLTPQLFSKVDEKECGVFEEILERTSADNPMESKSISQVKKILLPIQECEDEKIQLSSAMMESIEVRTRQLDQDLENIEPQIHTSESVPVKISSRRELRNEKPNSKPNVEPPPTTATTVTPVSKRRRANSCQLLAVPSSIKSVQPKAEDPVPVKNLRLSVTSIESKPTTSSRQTAAIPRQKLRSNKSEKREEKNIIEQEDLAYCLCGQISYGEMIRCGNVNCPIQWFHFNCVNLANKTKGRWFCPKCRGDKSNIMKKL